VNCPDIGSRNEPSAPIAPGATKSVLLERTNVPPGTYTWVFTVDPENKIAESSEANNTKSVQSRPEATSSPGANGGRQVTAPNSLDFSIAA
jgi:hypothetical protein